jgi:hypothetical protein
VPVQRVNITFTAGYLIVRFSSLIPCLVWHTRASRSHVDVKLRTCTRALLSSQHTSLVSSNFSLFFFISISAVGPLMSPQRDNVLAPYTTPPKGSFCDGCCKIYPSKGFILQWLSQNHPSEGFILQQLSQNHLAYD